MKGPIHKLAPPCSPLSPVSKPRKKIKTKIPSFFLPEKWLRRARRARWSYIIPAPARPPRRPSATTTSTGMTRLRRSSRPSRPRTPPPSAAASPTRPPRPLQPPPLQPKPCFRRIQPKPGFRRIYAVVGAHAPLLPRCGPPLLCYPFPILGIAELNNPLGS